MSEESGDKSTQDSSKEPVKVKLAEPVHTEVVSDGRFWKLVIGEDNPDKHLVSKVISNSVKPDIQTRVNIDVKDKEFTNEDGTKENKKEVLTNVSEVWYPKFKYSRQEVEKAAELIAEKNAEADCPLCQKMKAAIDVKERQKLPEVFGVPSLKEVMPELSVMFEPVATAVGGLGEIINDILNSPFDYINPNQRKDK